MTMEQIKKEAESLSYEEKGHLAAFLVQLRNRQDPTYIAELRHRIVDKNPAHWLTPDEVETRFNSQE